MQGKRLQTGSCEIEGEVQYVRHSGGYSVGVPPLPIPNREVKPNRADGTAYSGRVGRRHLFPVPSSGKCLKEGFFVAFASKAQIIIFFNVAFTFCFISNDSYYKVTNSLDNPCVAVSAFELTFALYLKQ